MKMSRQKRKAILPTAYLPGRRIQAQLAVLRTVVGVDVVLARCEILSRRQILRPQI